MPTRWDALTGWLGHRNGIALLRVCTRSRGHSSQHKTHARTRNNARMAMHGPRVLSVRMPLSFSLFAVQRYAAPHPCSGARTHAAPDERALVIVLAVRAARHSTSWTAIPSGARCFSLSPVLMEGTEKCPNTHRVRRAGAAVLRARECVAWRVAGFVRSGLADHARAVTNGT